VLLVFYLIFGVPLAGIAASPAVVGLSLILSEGFSRLRLTTFLPLGGFLIGLASAYLTGFILPGAFLYTAIPFAVMGGTLGYCVFLVLVPVAWLVHRRGGRLTLDAIMLMIALGSIAAVAGVGVFVFIRSLLPW
jgi:hypothetical protein